MVSSFMASRAALVPPKSPAARSSAPDERGALNADFISLEGEPEVFAIEKDSFDAGEGVSPSSLSRILSLVDDFITLGDAPTALAIAYADLICDC